MNAEEAIRKSPWWREAQGMPDRHYDESAGVTLADHLHRVHENLRLVLSSDGLDGYFEELRQALANMGLNPGAMLDVLRPVALLHDIGKTREQKDVEGEHPLTQKAVKMRHPIVGLLAAIDTLPEDQENRDTVLVLVEEHDTPFSWYMQFQRSGEIPKRKSWARLDRKIDPREDGTGLILLSVFKLADIDGHADVSDVPWFIDQVNQSFLREKGRWLPVPDQSSIQRLEQESN
jgi:hypothetical protein